MTTLVYEMEMDDFSKSLLETDPSYKIKILQTLNADDPLQIKYKVEVTEERRDKMSVRLTRTPDGKIMMTNRNTGTNQVFEPRAQIRPRNTTFSEDLTDLLTPYIGKEHSKKFIWQEARRRWR